MAYSDDDVAEMQDRCEDWLEREGTLTSSLFRLQLQVPQAREMMTHGVCRRLSDLKHGLRRVFETLPPQEAEPAREAIWDATAFLQAFVINIFGVMDNLAWLWCLEADVRGPNGRPLHRSRIGLTPDNADLRGSLSARSQAYGFEPQDDWVANVVASVTRAPAHNDPGFSLSFTRAHPRITASLDVEPVLANGRRPDFRLRFAVGAAQGERRSILRNVMQSRSQAGLVMDAKFRTRWKLGELSSMLTSLIDIKKYGQDGDKVFILQPAKAAIEHPTSPLGWRRDCDYGQNHPTGHAHGSIQLAADPISGAASLTNLRRLIALELQQIFPPPESEEVRDEGGAGSWGGTTEICRSTSTFCIACGETHEPADLKPDRTERGNRKWYFRCSRCGTGTMQTHCFGCGASLHKNGQQMTYHLTVADQISNVVCPDCGAGF